MSGGVDSSLALRLLAELPLDLSVLFMRNWDPLLSENQDSDSAPSPASSASAAAPAAPYALSYAPAPGHQCEWERDFADVRRVAAHVGVPASRICLVDLSKEYWGRVFEPAVGVWERGGTPNPDVACNREIKFGALFEHLAPNHYLATGHYARVRRSAAGATLHRATDANKDQTYYLSQIREPQLARSVFPLAGLRKPEVRQLAAHFALPTAARAESMGVCFIGERGRFGEFVSQYTADAGPAHLVSPAGEQLAPSRGAWHYTIGQRARLPGMDGRWFVARKNVGAGGEDVLVVPGADHPALLCVELAAPSFHWIAGALPPQLVEQGRMRALVQVRHRMAPVPALVVRGTLTPDADAGGSGVRVVFDTPLAAVAPGQVVGVWDGEQCLGSGEIARTVCADQARSCSIDVLGGDTGTAFIA
ncbi:hypothetical protein Q5752_001497 [Cryptotrichosporon argae]